MLTDLPPDIKAMICLTVELCSRLDARDRVGARRVINEACRQNPHLTDELVSLAVNLTVDWHLNWDDRGAD